MKTGSLRPKTRRQGVGSIPEGDTFVYTGNNEGTLSRKFEVRGRDGRALMTSRFETEWEYHGAVHGRFDEDGTVLALPGTDGTSERTAIPGVE